MVSPADVAHVEVDGEKAGDESAERGDGCWIVTFRPYRDYPVGGNLGVLEGL
jgi:hypothetical protein